LAFPGVAVFSDIQLDLQSRPRHNLAINFCIIFFLDKASIVHQPIHFNKPFIDSGCFVHHTIHLLVYLSWTPAPRTSSSWRWPESRAWQLCFEGIRSITHQKFEFFLTGPNGEIIYGIYGL
jgi:hypothetical protein